MIRMKDLRLRADISQSELSRRAGLHSSTVNAIENGRLRPWPGQLRKLAVALCWPLDRAAELMDEVSAVD